MDTQARLMLFIAILILGGILVYLPIILFGRLDWLSTARFKKLNPNDMWIIDVYTYAVTIWIALSIIFTARYFQYRTTLAFYVAVYLIPLIGLGLIKGIMEIFCGVSIFLGMQSRKRQKNPVISFAFNKTGLLSLVEFRYRIAKDKDKVERVGAIRVAANLAALVGLLFFLL